MRALGALFLVILCACGDEDFSVDDAIFADEVAAEPVAVEVADMATADPIALARIRVLRGVDRAGVFSTREARVLKNDHNVRWTGVYIGGPCSGGFGWTKSRVAAIARATHWRFMPIFVGQQTASICGAHNLTFAQGQTDGRAAVRRMRAFGWGAHKAIPVALDVEAGTYFDHPRGSTRYVRGWVNAVHAAGYRAYVYSTPFGLDHWHAAKVRIDAAWAASFFFRGFRRVKPGELDQMHAFRNNNRAWQYAGNFRVSGAGVIDASTSNLLLAPGPGGTNRTLASARLVPAASCGALAPGEGLAAGESLASCDGHTVLAMSSDGNLTLARDGATMWSSNTLGIGIQAILDDTGELVVVDADNEPVFATATGGFPEATLEVGDGTLALVDDDGARLWDSTTGLLVGDDAAVDAHMVAPSRAAPRWYRCRMRAARATAACPCTVVPSAG
jgi:hypothetical protein